MKLSQKVVAKLKKFWMRFILRGVRYNDDRRKFDSFYMVNDPWHMASPSEQYRFAETNRLILEKFGRVGSILEIGCGEGHHTFHLQQVCECLTGLDVSNKAVERARRRYSGSEFLVGDVFSQEIGARAPFDLVVACEVLYYMRDIPMALGRIRALGRNILVTYFTGEMETLDPHVLSLAGAVSKIIELKQARWRAVWWRGDQF